MIRSARPEDAQAIADIYNHYVLNTTVTFEEEAVSAYEMKTRISEILEKYPWLVFEENGNVIGYAYSSPWKSRCAYRYSVEVSVYLKPGISGKGIGSILYSELLKLLKPLSIHGVIGGMALPNDNSIALHKKFGFEQIAHFKEVGFKFDQWIDVVYYEKIL